MKRGLKVIALALLSAMMFSLIAGCGSEAPAADAGGAQSAQPAQSAPAAEPPKDEKVSIRVCSSFTGSDQWAPVWKSSIEQFMQDNPNVTIEDESTPTAQDALRTKVKADIASGNEPEVLFYFTGQEAQFVIDSGRMFVWDDELKNDAEWGKNFSQGILDKAKVDGKQYCLPYVGFYEGLYWNKDLFDKFGLEGPTTYDNFLKAVDTFAKNDIVPIAMAMNRVSYMLEAFILSQVGPEGQKNYFDQSWAPALERIKELYKKHAFPKDTLTISDEDARALYGDQKAAMLINGSWAASNSKDLPNSMITTVPMLPGGKVGPEAVIAGFGSAFYMNAKMNEDKNGVPMKFIKFLTSPDTMAKFVAIGGSPAVNCKLPENSSKLSQSAAEMIAKAQFFEVPIDSQVSNEAFFKLRDDMAYVVNDRKTPEKLLEEAKAIHEKNK